MNSLKSFFVSFHILIVAFLCSNVTLSQNLSELSRFADDKEKKTLENAFAEIREAGKLTQKANESYGEALKIQSDATVDEKTLQKKVAKAEEDAVTCQVKSDKLYASAHKSLYEVSRKILGRSGTDSDNSERLKAEAEMMFANAAEKRKQSSDVKDVYEKASLLNEATGLESAAIENLIFAIRIAHGESDQDMSHDETTVIVKPRNSQSTQEYKEYIYTVDQKSENLAIDRSVVDMYDSYVNDPSIPDPITIGRDGITGVDDVSVENARRIFSDYHSRIVVTPPPDTVTQLTSISEDTSGAASLSDNLSVTGTTEDTRATGKDKIKPEIEHKKPGREKSNSDPYNEARKEFDLSSTLQTSDIQFMVQVGASRAPLSRAQMWAIYPGGHTIDVIFENGWYKYRITGFRLFSEAHRVAVESGVRGSYVVAYEHGIPINLVLAREKTRVMETDVKRYGRKIIKHETDYYVQLAASRIRLSPDNMERICRTGNNCREIIEEGWYKYQIYSGSDYNKALELKNSSPDGSFIVAYESGRKIQKRK